MRGGTIWTDGICGHLSLDEDGQGVPSVVVMQRLLLQMRGVIILARYRTLSDSLNLKHAEYNGQTPIVAAELSDAQAGAVLGVSKSKVSPISPSLTQESAVVLVKWLTVLPLADWTEIGMNILTLR